MRVKIEAEDYIRQVKSDEEVTQGDGLITQQHKYEQPIKIPTVIQENIPTHEVSITEVSSRVQSGNNNGISECRFQMEKPSLPKFSGDVRDYATFKYDFKNIVEARY